MTTQEQRWRHQGIKGASKALYEALLNQQGGGCFFCQMAPVERPLTLDFNPDTGKIRGLLCKTCRTLIHHIDLLMENKDLFQQLLAYIEADGEPHVAKSQLDIVGYNPNLARPNIELKRERVRKRALKLLETRPARSLLLMDLAAEFGLSERTVRRYLSNVL